MSVKKNTSMKSAKQGPVRAMPSDMSSPVNATAPVKATLAEFTEMRKEQFRQVKANISVDIGSPLPEVPTMPSTCKRPSDLRLIFGDHDWPAAFLLILLINQSEPHLMAQSKASGTRLSMRAWPQ